MTMMTWWHNRARIDHTKELHATIEQLRNDLYDAHKEASMWKIAFQSLHQTTTECLSVANINAMIILKGEKHEKNNKVDS